VIVKGQVPGVPKQSSLFQDNLGHAKKPLSDFASYSKPSVANLHLKSTDITVVWFGAMYGISPIGSKVLAAGTPPGQAEVLQKLAWATLKSEPSNGLP
jgi:hypothetical protein